VSHSALALIAAAAGVGFGHAVLPDHWVPLATLGRTRRYPLVRIARLSGLAGIAHVLVSLLLGAIVIAVGLQFRSAIESAESAIVGWILIATGVGFAVLELSGHGHHHDGAEGHGHDHHEHGLSGLTGVMVPFGAAASPDLTILPVFLAATAVGAPTAIGALVAFAAVTIATIVVLTLAAARGGYHLHAEWLERWGNVVTALVLVLIGALVLTGTL
jgi:nickel/cobalt transporter (NicO) family protein